jgi:MYXO-CTERM domain-containing protein
MRWGAIASIVVCVACTSPSRESQLAQSVTQCGSGSANLVEGVDVYSGTGAIDWAKLAASGRHFAFIKATQGNYDTQSTFGSDWSGALAAGVLRSPYHFFDGTIDGVTQANSFLAELTAAGGLAVGDLPPMLDIECPTASTQAASSANCEYTGDSGWVAPATLQQRIFDWLDTVHTATGTMPILYSYVSWFADVQVTDSMLADYPLFIASYNSCATVPAPWTAATFWQYSATGTVPGVPGTGDVDEDRFFGDLTQLETLTVQPPVMTESPDAGVVAESPDAGLVPEHQTGGCASSDAPSPWWLAGFAALVIAIRSRRKPRRRRPERRKVAR